MIPKSKNFDITIKNRSDKKGNDIYVTVDGDNFSLFRYRSINKFTLQQFANDEVFATIPSAFNDPYDSTYIFKENKIKSKIKKYLNQNEEVTKDLINIFASSEPSIRNTKRLIKYVYDFTTNFPMLFKKLSIGIASFSWDINQEIMWSHYANYSKGFALEYKYNNLVDLAQKNEKEVFEEWKKTLPQMGLYFDFNGLDQKTDLLLPVDYQKNKYDFSWFHINFIERMFDYILKNKKWDDQSFAEVLMQSLITPDKKNEGIDFFKNIYLRKKTEWKYEKEWRLSVSTKRSFAERNESSYTKVGNLVPNAIYLGEHIALRNENGLIKIAKKKGIRVYKMKTLIARNTLKLYAINMYAPQD